MDEIELLKFKEPIERKIVEVEKRLVLQKAWMTEHYEKEPNILLNTVDFAREDSELSKQQDLHERHLQDRDALYEAKKRIEDCSFGLCMECGEDISETRLIAVPSCAYCLECQEWHDKKRSPIKRETILDMNVSWFTERGNFDDA